MTITTDVGAHPITAAIATARSALAEIADAQPIYLSPTEKADALREAARLETQVAELRLRVTAAAGEVAADAGCRDVAAWQATRLQADLRQARADQALARSLDRDHPAMTAALRDGRASLAQARVVVAAVDALPAEVGADLRDRAEADLIGLCAAHTPDELRRLGRAILNHVAPDVADELEAKRLQDEEAAAWRRSRLTLRPTGDGTTRLSGLLPDAAATRLRTYLEAFTSPRGKAVNDEVARAPYPRRLAHAFVHLLERLDPTKLPEQSGDATTLMVTIPLAGLQNALATATLLDDPDRAISAAEARRLACTAKIIPAVLGNHSEVLDLGRADRLYRPAQRRAMQLRDRTCRTEGYTVPAKWCDAHHLVPWSSGGHTNLDDGALFCPWHHHRAHDPAYIMEKLADGTWRFVKKRQ